MCAHVKPVLLVKKLVDINFVAMSVFSGHEE